MLKKHGAFLVIAAVLLITIVASALLFRSNGTDQVSTSPLVPPVANPTKDTVVTLEEFGDYQCPPCGQLHPTLKALKQQFGSNLNLVFRNLPLSDIHPNALAAAQAAEAARMQNRFWEMHDLIYESQDLWKDEKNPKPRFLQYAKDLGLDLERFRSDMNGDQVKYRIEADRDAAVRLSVDGTPTILINGQQLRPEVTNAEGVRKGIELMMARKPAQAPNAWGGPS